MTTEDTFFKGKRPWSVVKDRIIGNYLTPYIRKVSQLGKPILFIDGFVGPGLFEDGTLGSPFLICEKAEQSGKVWSAVFVNHNQEHHQQLSSVIRARGWQKNAMAILGNCTDLLEATQETLTDQTVFIYLDPFGLKGFSFKALVPYFERVARGLSIEIVINVSIPTLHRLAAAKVVAEGRAKEPRILARHQTLTDALGGDWWQAIMWSDQPREQRVHEIMCGLTERLAVHLPFTGYCPVQEDANSCVKYYITFASRHQDAQLLMNDQMCRVYEQYIFDARGKGIQGQLWGLDDERDLTELNNVIIETVRQNPGQSRENIWKAIVPEHFMRWTESEFNDRVKMLAEAGKLEYLKDPKTKRFNKTSLLFLPR